MHVVRGYGMVWASIRDPYLKREGAARMLGERIGKGESSYTEYDTAVTVEPNEENFRSPEERRAAFIAYHGLCSFQDHNVGRLMSALESNGLVDDTLVVYTSDHGDNLGARGVWGKSTLYQESVTVPMIAAGPGLAPGSVCRTPVDLLDLYPTILDGAGVGPAPETNGRPGRSLLEVAAAPEDRERPIFSEHHAAGSNTAGFMLRKGRWNYGGVEQASTMGSKGATPAPSVGNVGARA